MNDSPAFQFVRQLGMDLAAGEFDLPPFPDTPLRVQQTMNDPNATLADLAPIVASEPALAARLMRMANSAMMRRGPMEVTDITTAISRLGMDMVMNAAVTFASREAFKLPAGTARAAANCRSCAVTAPGWRR
jgi:HD-like signal output (HDOD) protein